MSDKAESLFKALRESVESPLSLVEETVLFVHAIFVSNGYVPETLKSTKGHVCLLPSPEWPSNAGTDNVFVFKYVGGIELKCIGLGPDSVAFHLFKGNEHFSLQLEVAMSHEEQGRLAEANLVKPLEHKSEQAKEVVGKKEEKEKVYVMQEPSGRGGRREWSPPRAPPLGGRRPYGPGELVGPNHPLFTGHEEPRWDEPRIGDPRFDPIGPGTIGEPGSDHFPPPPFSQPPGARRPPGRAPLRGPNAGDFGPGNMFM